LKYFRTSHKAPPPHIPFEKVRNFFLGHPLRTSAHPSTRLGFWLGLPILAVDALSSVAYATEEILLALTVAGAALIPYALPISLVIVFLLTILVISYTQVIEAYPEGGGAYVISKHNLGNLSALVGAASLMIDYTLTVAVSVTAATRALTSAYPQLIHQSVLIAIFAVFFLTWLNLRGIRQSAQFVLVPVYLFIILILGLGGWGTFSPSLSSSASSDAPLPSLLNLATLLVILRAFAGGCTAMTGLEVIANAGKMIQKPQLVIGRRILFALGLCLGLSFLLITLASLRSNLMPLPHESLLSQLARTAWGSGALYWSIQILTAMILFLAANTAFAGFPKLVAIVAQDGWLPKQLSAIGDRLVFSTAITLLGITASILCLIFQGDTHTLIPLYAIGVFTAFSLSQFGMVRYWLSLYKNHRQRKTSQLGLSLKISINCIGAFLTTLTLCVTFEAKFLEGGFLVLIAVPLIVLFCYLVKKHYNIATRQLLVTPKDIKAHKPKFSKSRQHTIVVPLSRLHKGSLEALSFARELSADVHVIIADINQPHIHKIKEQVENLNWGLKVIILPSPYRSITLPIIEYVKELDAKNKHPAILVLPEFVTARWWQNFLHNHTANLISQALAWNEDIPNQSRIIINVPYYLEK